VEYDVTELDQVVLAYATTVHKSQGSEYQVVVAPLTMQHYMMLQRNLLYTCVTRAKKVFVLVGTEKAIYMAVSNNKIQQRNTMLSQRLKIKK
jgi:exodeoxyribonuclease V alpha subunit